MAPSLKQEEWGSRLGNLVLACLPMHGCPIRLSLQRWGTVKVLKWEKSATEYGLHSCPCVLALSAHPVITSALSVLSSPPKCLPACFKSVQQGTLK